MDHRHVTLALALLVSGCPAEDEQRDLVELAANCVEHLAPGEGVLLMLEELGPPVLSSRDLDSGDDSTVYAVPSMGFAYEFDVADPGLALAYTPPPTDGESGYDRSWIARLDDGEPARLAGEDGAGSWAFYPTWAADGESLWFVATGESVAASSMLSRVDLATGIEQPLIADATEPAVSPRGDAMVWVQVDADSGARRLMAGDEQAGEPRVLVDSEEVGDLGQPFVSTDGAWVYFIVIEPDESSWADLLVPSAQAHSSHDQPGDWWRVAIDGGEPERVTFLQTIHYDGAASGEGFVAATREGVVRVDVATGTATMLRCARTVRAVGVAP